MKKSTLGSIGAVCCIIFAAVVLIITGINPSAELELANKIMDTDNHFGLFFEIFGYWPFFVPMLLSTSFFLFYRKKRSRIINILTGFLCVLGIIISSGYLGGITTFFILGYLGKPVSAIIIVPWLIIAALGIIAIRCIPKRYISTLSKAANCIITFVLASEAVSWALKLPWGRIRPRDVGIKGDFTPWFILNGLSGNQSFPSGHTMESTGIFIVIFLLVALNPKFAKYKTLLTVFGTFWVMSVGISRLFLGAHYISDVVTGAVLSITVGHLVTYLYKQEKLMFRKKIIKID